MTDPLEGLVRDGGVVIPDRLAGEVARLLGRALVLESRTTGAPVTPAAIALLRALDEAARRPAPAVTSANASAKWPQRRPLSTVEAGVVLGVSTRWVRWLCSTGRLPAQRDGKVWHIDPADLETYRRAHDDRDRDGPQPLPDVA